MRNTPSQSRTVEKIRAILAACEELLLEVPSEHITTTMIAERAGTTRTSMYHFFPSKMDVFDALADKYYKQLRARILTAFDPSTSTEYGKAWRGIATVYREFFEENPSASVLLLGKKGSRQAIFAQEQTELELATEIHSLMTQHTNFMEKISGEPPDPDLFQFVLDLMTSLFSSSVRREGKISPETEENVQRATIAYLQSVSRTGS